MDLKTKIANLLSDTFEDAFVRLEGEKFISGFVVSPGFDGVASLERQRLIDEALEREPGSLSLPERRRVLMIAALTPREFESIGPGVRIHKIKDLGRGIVEVVVHGSIADADFVRRALADENRIDMTEPKQVPRAPGILVSFRAKSRTEVPLTRQKMLELLKNSPYIGVTAGI